MTTFPSQRCPLELPTAPRASCTHSALLATRPPARAIQSDIDALMDALRRLSVPAPPSRVADCAWGLVHQPSPPRYSHTLPGDLQWHNNTLRGTSMTFPSQCCPLESPTAFGASCTLPAPPRYSPTHPGNPERQCNTNGGTSMAFPSQRCPLELSTAS